jgi:hypothetical protein
LLSSQQYFITKVVYIINTTENVPQSCHGGKFQINPLGTTVMSNFSDQLTFRNQVHLCHQGSTEMLLVFEMSVDLTTLRNCQPSSTLLATDNVHL